MDRAGATTVGDWFRTRSARGFDDGPLPRIVWYAEVAAAGLDFLEALLDLPVAGDESDPRNLHAYPLGDRNFAATSACYRLGTCLSDGYLVGFAWTDESEPDIPDGTRDSFDWLRAAYSDFVSEARNPELEEFLGKSFGVTYRALKTGPAQAAQALEMGFDRPIFSITREELAAYRVLGARLQAIAAGLDVEGVGPRRNGEAEARLSRGQLRWLGRYSDPETRRSLMMMSCGFDRAQLMVAAYVDAKAEEAGGPVAVDPDAVFEHYAWTPEQAAAVRALIEAAERGEALGGYGDATPWGDWIAGSRRSLNKALGKSATYRDYLERLRDKGEIDLRADPEGFAIRFRRNAARHDRVKARLERERDKDDPTV